MAQSCAIDSITASVVQGALENIAVEMGYKLMRMSYSSIIRESEDFGAALVDANGRVESFRVISAPENAQKLLSKLDSMLIFTVFRPATAFGKPTPSRVVLSFSSVNVRG